MIYAILALGLIFILVGLITSEKNAKYLFPGYNSMSEDEWKSYDLRSFLGFYRKFHIILGVSLMVIALPLKYYISEITSVIFIVVYPLIAYIYFMMKSRKYQTGPSGKSFTGAVVILSASLIVVIIVFSFIFQDLGNDRIIIKGESIKIEGTYGETVSIAEIISVSLTNELPVISGRTNGIETDEIRKGYFKTAEGEIIKLILNGGNKPYILITKKDDRKIYYSSGEEPNEQIYSAMQKSLAKELFD